MTTNEILTLIALLLGPVSAVLITLWIDGRRRDNDRRVDVLRRLIVSRHLPADPTFFTAINLVPVEFHNSPKVMLAFNEFIAAAQVRLDGVNDKAIVDNTSNKTTRLIFEISNALGFKLRETDIQTTAYASGAWERNVLLAQDSQQAMRDVASVLLLQTHIMSGKSIEELRSILATPIATDELAPSAKKVS